MKTPPDIKQGLLHYLAGVGPTVGRLFGIRDFNAQVMMNSFSAQDRDGLKPALDALVEAGILVRVSSTEYSVTTHGARFIQGRDRFPEPRLDMALRDA